MSTFRNGTRGAPYAISSSGSQLSSYQFQNTTDQIEVVFQVQDPGDGTDTVTISRLGYRLTSVVGTSPVMIISLQSVNGSGLPGGLIAAGASGTFTPAGSATWNWVNLTTPYVATVGDWLYYVIAYSSGTFGAGANTPNFGVGLSSAISSIPYEVQNIAGARTNSAGQPIFGYGSTARAFGLPLQSLSITQISTPVENALRFLFDRAIVQSYKVVGIHANLRLPATGKVFAVNLYSGTTLLQTATVPANVNQLPGAARAVSIMFNRVNPIATLQGGQEYRVSIAPQDLLNNVAVNQVSFAAAADLDALPEGQNFYFSTRATGGATAWTDTLTSRPEMELIISDWTTPLGFTNRGMTGGLPG